MDTRIDSVLRKDNQMNIYAKKGDKVRFLNKNGHDHEPPQAIEAGLIEGEIYTVKNTDVGNWMSYVYLEEFPNQSFNTVMFDDVIPEQEAAPINPSQTVEHRFLKDETLEMIHKRGYAHPAEVLLLLQDLKAYKKKVKVLEKINQKEVLI